MNDPQLTRALAVKLLTRAADTRFRATLWNNLRLRRSDIRAAEAAVFCAREIRKQLRKELP